jgi:hypothetical protein
MPRNVITQGETIQDLQNLAATMAANSAEYPHLEPPRVQLEGFLSQVGPLITLQADLAAQRQETSRKLRELLTGARRLGSFLRAGLKQHYGPSSEKLAAFRLLPFRGRKPVKPGEAVNPPEPAPAAPGPQKP